VTPWRAAFGVACVVHLVALYLPRSPSPDQTFPYADKLVHVLLFAVVAYTGVKIRLPVWWLAGVLTADAVISEVFQHAVLSQRSGDPWDAVADLFGLLVGVFLGSRDIMDT
jgi:VanZ family protein